MISKLPAAREPINLQGGWPTPRLHPVANMQKAAANLFAKDTIAEQLKYGPERGDVALRSNIAQWLTSHYQPTTGAVTQERIIVTNGASNGLATILQKFADPGVTRNIWMVEPTYFLACPVFRDAGFAGRIRAVPEGAAGVDLTYLRKALEDEARNGKHDTIPLKTPKNGYPKIYRHILYMVATFSNPSGNTMSPEDRIQLVLLAREHDMLIVSDDVYDILSWTEDGEERLTRGSSPPRLVDIDRATAGTAPFGNTVSNGSFSKIVAPGVRVGWLEGSSDFVLSMGTVGASVSGGCQGHMASLIINELLESGDLDRHLQDVVIPTYRQRYHSMVAAIRQHLYPLGVSIATDRTKDTIPEGIQKDTTTVGGFFLYLVFPDDGTLPSTSDIAQVALDQYSLRIAPGRLFTVVDDSLESGTRSTAYLHGARLCWAWHEEDELVEGIERLAEVLQQLKRII